MVPILFEDDRRDDFLPLTFTRPIYDLRIGIDTIREKWARFWGMEPGAMAAGYLGSYYNKPLAGEKLVWINGRFIPNLALLSLIQEALEPGHFLLTEKGDVLAFSMDWENVMASGGIITAQFLSEAGLKPLSVGNPDALVLRRLSDIFQMNKACIEQDFGYFAQAERNAMVTDPNTAVYGKDNIYVHPTAKIRAAVLNAEDGPIYIGPHVEVQEGAMVRGAHAFCEGAVLNMGAKLRGDSTIGPVSKVGGEVANSVIMGYSNKGHDGYLGNSVLGYWCNLGADTNTSNLKNNYAEVKLWNYRSGRFERTGTQFCGLIMGDHSKCGINTMFNTGTVVGVSANIFGAGYPRNFIPSYSWGGAAGLTTFKFDQAMEVARVVLGRRKLELSAGEEAVLKEVFDRTAQYRTWEKAQ